MDLDFERRALAVLERVLERREPVRKAELGRLCGDDPGVAPRRRDDASVRSLGIGFPPGFGLEVAMAQEARRPTGLIEPTAGTELGAYRLLRVLGEGGMSRVFLGERCDGQFEQQVAVKVMRDRLGRSGELRSRFEQNDRSWRTSDTPISPRLLDGASQAMGDRT